MGFRRSRRRDEKGAAAVEFALVMPILMILIFGIVDFGLAINQYATASNAAREGVRAAALGTRSADVANIVKGYVGGDTNQEVTVAVSCKTPAGGNCSSFDAMATSGGTALVTVTIKRPWITPVGAAFANKSIVSKTSRMRIE